MTLHGGRRSHPSTAQPRKRLPVGMPAGRRPRVTVVVPCYNYERYLGACVASALEQPGVEVDVIIVDDRSTDDSLTLARALGASDPRVQVIAHQSNQGPVGTFNDGLVHARGQYLVRLDADDLLTAGALARAVAVMEAEPQRRAGLWPPVALHRAPGADQCQRRTASWTIWPGRAWLEGGAGSAGTPSLRRRW